MEGPRCSLRQLGYPLPQDELEGYQRTFDACEAE